MRPTPRPRPSHVVGAAALGCALLLSGCGGGSGELRTGGSEEPAEDATAAEVTPEAPSDLPTEAPADPPPGADDLTAPGSRLELGQPAVVTAAATGGGAEGVVQLTVTGVETGSPEDLAGVEGVGDGVTVYVSFEVTALSGAESLAGWTPGQSMLGLQTGGVPSGVVISAEPVAGCESAEVPDGWADGDTLSSCFTALSLGGIPVEGAAYSQPGTDYDQVEGTGVTWLP